MRVEETIIGMLVVTHREGLRVTAVRIEWDAYIQLQKDLHAYVAGGEPGISMVVRLQGPAGPVDIFPAGPAGDLTALTALVDHLAKQPGYAREYLESLRALRAKEE